MSTQQHWSSHYLDQFVTNLASLLRVDTVYVSQFNHSTNTFSVLSNMARGVLNAEQDIDFDSLPCREAYRLGALEYNDNLLDAFPGQLILRDWLVQSYMGVVLLKRRPLFKLLRLIWLYKDVFLTAVYGSTSTYQSHRLILTISV